MKKIYLASSWRNTMQPPMVITLRQAGFEVYDFRDSDKGFHWRDIDKHWALWSTEEYLTALEHPLAQQGFFADYKAMHECDTMVLLLPCGKSSHLELGWAVGQGKKTAILSLQDSLEPELMYKMVDHVSDTVHDLLGWLGVED